MCLRAPGEATAITIISLSRVAKASSAWLLAAAAQRRSNCKTSSVSDDVAFRRNALQSQPLGEDVGTADGAAFAAVFSAGSAFGCGVTGVAMPSNSETVTNLKPLASSSSKVEGIASIVPG